MRLKVWVVIGVICAGWVNIHPAHARSYDFTQENYVVESVTPTDGATHVSPYVSPSITFSEDSNLDNAIKHIIVNASSPYTLTRNGRSVTVNFNSSLDLGEEVIIEIQKPDRGVSSEGGWVYRFKVEARRDYVIGRSLQGRSIYATTFGSGERVFAYVGAIHGNEWVTRWLLNQWTVYLDENQWIIPEDVKLVIIPNANPDGVAVNSRFNANWVDLNRNWGTDNWTSNSWFGGSICYGCGGVAPFSEPETRAIKDFLVEQNIDYLLSFHVADSCVIPGSVYDSESVFLAWYYHIYSGLSYTSDYVSFVGGSYPITGDMTNYFVTKRSVHSITVEGDSWVENMFPSHLDALNRSFLYR